MLQRTPAGWLTPPKTGNQDLTSSVCQGGLLWKWDLRKYNVESWDEIILGFWWVLNPITCVLIRDRKGQHTETRRGRPCVIASRGQIYFTTAKEHREVCTATKSQEDGMEQILCQSFHNESNDNTLIRCFWPCETINLPFKPLGLWWFVSSGDSNS